jgi:hypothetical protein
MKTKTEQKVNTRALLSHAFETMKSLKTGDISVEDAKAQANLIKQSNNLLKYELDKAVAICKYDNIQINNIED